MEKWMKKAWLALGVFVVIAPLGILVTWDYGDAQGEWGSVETGNATWTPGECSGGAPLPDYNVPGWESRMMASIGYWISAVIGIGMSVISLLGVAKAIELWRESV